MQPAPAGVVKAIAHVSPSAFAEAAAAIHAVGSLHRFDHGPRKPTRADPVINPLITYLGTNCCPYCAATRWPLAVAFAMFGTFKRLTMTASGTEEPFAGTPTLSFCGSNYNSRYIAFSPIEQCSDVPSATASALLL